MGYFEVVLILIVVVLGLWVAKLYQEKNQTEAEAKALEKEAGEYRDMGRGLAEYQQKMQERKDRAKQKIMDLLKEKGRVSNREAAGVLNISSASARRYFDELEAESKAKQVGKTGKSVYYSAI